MNLLKRIICLLVLSIHIQNGFAENFASPFAEDATHHVVFQLNKSDPDYINHVLFSAGALIRKYGDDIQIVIVAIGPGLHLLGKHPGRFISESAQQHAGSLAQYGISFHACGNTMKSLKWNNNDLLDFAEIVPIGADDIMQLQENGFAYLSW